MENAQNYSKAYCSKLIALAHSLDHEAVARVADLFLRARNEGKKILFIGNGGSAATASHFCNDLGVGTRLESKPFRALSLTDHMPTITAVANDHGYEQIFVKQLQVLAEPGDVVVAISASGNSPNLLRAIEWAKDHQNPTVGLVGFDGGAMKKLCTTVIHIETPKGEYGLVEDMHMVLDHLISSYLVRAVREGSA